jgi:threonine/homoserine/homoserine lactone efflux protein
MDLETFRQGTLIGLAVAAPVGPIGILVIQRSLGGALLGLATGLGAAVADAAYALTGALATAFVLRVFAAAWLIELVGAGLLAWLALRTFRQPPADVLPTRTTSLHLARAFGETLFLTLANPATVVSFVAVAASRGLAQSGHAGVFALGVFAGSAAWWLFLSSSVRLASRRVTPKIQRLIRTTSSLILATFALLALAKALTNP